MAFPTNLPIASGDGTSIVNALRAIYEDGIPVSGLPAGLATSAKQDEQSALLAVNADGLIITAAIKSVYDKLTNGGLSAADILATIYAYLPNIATAVTNPVVITGRTYVIISGKATGTGSVYTVTPGKKLYVTSIFVTGFFSVAGQLVVKDNATVIAGSQSSTTVIINGLGSLPTPVQFSTNVTIDKDGGTLTNSYYTLIGWEQ